MKYIVALDIFQEQDDNPTFRFDTFEEMTDFIRICFKNDYRVLVSEVKEKAEPDIENQ